MDSDIQEEEEERDSENNLIVEEIFSLKNS